MNILYSKDITGFKVSIVVTDNKKLAVRLDNTDGEYVGQLFSSLDNVADLYSRLSSGEKLSNKELKDIKDKYNKIASNESINTVDKLLNSSLTETDEIHWTKGKLQTDLQDGRITLKKGTEVYFYILRDMLTIRNLPNQIKLNSLDVNDIVIPIR